MDPVDMKDIAIIDAFPVYDCERKVLNVGCGAGRIDFHLAEMGYRVDAFDIKAYDTWADGKNLRFHKADIFESQNLEPAPIVICSQMLEHLKEYKQALVNLVALAQIRLVITIPYRKSFNGGGEHCNFWDDCASGEFKDVHEFHDLCHPFGVAISKIRTKLKDSKTDKYNYLIIVDKKQNYTRGPQ
ncbi:MAG: class I SAM-dependent methyltransferase [Desulfobacteraceae bacterium]|nr:class I SAM-dependent methyltransferase [Desulfobacteraceae bacterium]